MRIITGLCCLILLAFTQSSAVQSAAATVLPGATAVHAELILLELFTSQGCSSCPPADALLAELTAEAAQGDLPVVALSYHVDYWNRLGWTDPYSQQAFSERQRAYARKLPDNNVYTPQLVVHGRSGHVGSREKEVRTAIQTARGGGMHTHIQIGKRNGQRGQTVLVYQLDGATDNLILNVALVEAALGNEVPKGENRGRNLQHVQVVRQLQQLTQPETTGSIPLDLGVLDKPEAGQVVVFVQDADTWAVRGVAVLKGL